MWNRRNLSQSIWIWNTWVTLRSDWLSKMSDIGKFTSCWVRAVVPSPMRVWSAVGIAILPWPNSLFRWMINLSQNILGLTGLSRQVCSHILDAIYLHVLRPFVILPTWFIPMRLQNLNFQPPNSIWNLQRKFDFLMIQATYLQSSQKCFPSLLIKIKTQNVDIQSTNDHLSHDNLGLRDRNADFITIQNFERFWEENLLLLSWKINLIYTVSFTLSHRPLISWKIAHSDLLIDLLDRSSSTCISF